MIFSFFNNSFSEQVERMRLRKRTNGDVIRSLSDEELADLIVVIRNMRGSSVYANGRCMDDGEIPDSFWLEWLKREARE